jgi:hypothetical protein
MVYVSVDDICPLKITDTNKLIADFSSFKEFVISPRPSEISLDYKFAD